MKKYLKIFIVFVFSLCVLGIINKVNANSINSISMDVYVDVNGNATITETWMCNTTKGTEVYHPYYNLGNSEIKNLTVSDSGNKYETLSNWNTSGSLSSKANKCGINKISNGVELCWGISSYGQHTYTVKYEITNFISQLTDGTQMLYWTFIPYDFSTSIGNAYIKVHTDFDISQDIDVWGYGNYGGTAYVYDGYIEMQSDGNLDTDEYMTMLVKFPEGSFNATNLLDYDFNHYYNMAEEGAVHYNEKEPLFIRVMKWIAFIFIGLLFSIIIGATKADSKEMKFGKAGKKISKDILYYRDIPCNKDLFKAYYIGYSYGIFKKKTDLLGAIILKWLKESIIRVDKVSIKKLLNEKEETAIVLNETDESKIINVFEKQLFNMFMEASKDGILESKEFEKWCKNHYSRILNWFDKILEDEKKKLTNEGLIEVKEKKIMGIFNKEEYTATDRLKEEAINLAGLKKFLKEYTLIKDREAIQVELFEEYLIYAQMMGIAKEVAKEFKEIYPDIIEQSQYNSYDNIMFVNMYATHGISSAETARSRAESYSSGGGGFSSGGGRRWLFWSAEEAGGGFR